MIIWLPLDKRGVLPALAAGGKETHTLDHKILSALILSMSGQDAVIRGTKTATGWDVRFAIGENEPVDLPMDDATINQTLSDATGSIDYSLTQNIVVFNSDGTERVTSDEYEVGESFVLYQYPAVTHELSLQRLWSLNNDREREIQNLDSRTGTIESKNYDSRLTTLEGDKIPVANNLLDGDTQSLLYWNEGILGVRVSLDEGLDDVSEALTFANNRIAALEAVDNSQVIADLTARIEALENPPA